jgi:hypothetical protein
MSLHRASLPPPSSLLAAPFFLPPRTRTCTQLPEPEPAPTGGVESGTEGMGGGGVDSGKAKEEMSEYELKRAKRMEENKRLMVATGILPGRGAEATKDDGESEGGANGMQRAHGATAARINAPENGEDVKGEMEHQKQLDDPPEPQGIEGDIPNALSGAFLPPSE